MKKWLVEKGLLYWILDIAGFWLICNTVEVGNFLRRYGITGICNVVLTVLVIELGLLILRFSMKLYKKNETKDGIDKMEWKDIPKTNRLLIMIPMVLGFTLGIIFFIKSLLTV